MKIIFDLTSNRRQTFCINFKYNIKIYNFLIFYFIIFYNISLRQNVQNSQKHY